jgi:hydroxymethylbilane synthase
VTARLAIHDDVTASAEDVLARLGAAGVDVETVTAHLRDAGRDRNPLGGLRDQHLDLVVVGMRILRSAAEDVTMLAVLPREDPRDMVIGLRDRAPLRGLERGARVAVTGARREALLRAHRPDVEVVRLRPEVDDPLLDETLDALIVWSGDARRAGLAGRATEVLDPRSWPPEPGQGAVAIVGRHPIAEVTALDHLPTRTALRAELALVDALDLPAEVGLGSHAQPSGRIMRLWAALASADGRRVVRADLTGPLDEPEQLGVAVARTLEARGARRVLAASMA